MLCELYASDASYSSLSNVIEIKKEPSINCPSVPTKCMPGGGYSYQSTASRFITWTTHKDILWLREYSLNFDIHRNVLQVQFSNACVLGCCVFESASDIFILVTTTDGVAVLKLKCPSQVSAQNSIWHNKNTISHNFYRVKNLSSQLITCVSANFQNSTITFAYGLKQCSILIATIRCENPDSLEVNEIKQISIYNKILSGIVPTLTGKYIIDPEESPISLEFIDFDEGSPILISISLDHRLRVWDVCRKSCLTNLDLLEELANMSKISYDGSDVSQLHRVYAPGTNHLIRTCERLSSTVNVAYAVVYFELNPIDQVLNSAGQVSYWIWIRLDLKSTPKGYASSVSVVHVEPIECVETAVHRLGERQQLNSYTFIRTQPLFSVIDFLPCLYHPLPNDQTFAKFSINNTYSSIGENMDVTSSDCWDEPEFGVWSLFDILSDEGSQTSYQPSLQWTGCSRGAIEKSLTALPPAFNLGDTSPSYQQPLPSEILNSSNSIGPSSSEIEVESNRQFDDFERSTEFDANGLLDFIFSPGRFSKFAIQSAIQGHKLSSTELRDVDTFQNLQETLNDILHQMRQQPETDSELQNYVSNLHSKVVDYHTQGIQPLGLFALSPGDSIHKPSDTIPMLNIAVARRVGFSVLRRLQPIEETLWTRRPMHYSEDVVITHRIKTVNHSTRDALLMHCRKISRCLSRCNCWLQHEHTFHRNMGNFVNPILALDKFISGFELEAEELSLKLLTDGYILPPKGPGFENEDIFSAFSWILSKLESPNEYNSFEKFENGDKSNLSQLEFEQGYNSKNSRILCSSTSAELLRQGLLQATDTRIRFCVSLYFCWRKLKSCCLKDDDNFYSTEILDSVNRESSCNDEEEEGICYDKCFQNRLVQLYRALLFIRWLGTTRKTLPRDQGDFSSVLIHLKLLGMNFADNMESYIGKSSSSGTPEISVNLSDCTILEDLYLKTVGFRSKLKSSIWHISAPLEIVHLQKRLSPILDEGDLMCSLLRNLTINACCKEIIKLCKLLAPVSFCAIGGSDCVSMNGNNWWNGDIAALHVCASLALLWSGFHGDAVDQYTEGSRYLYSCLLTVMPNNASKYPVEENVSPPLSVLSKMFPNEFGKSFMGRFASDLSACTPLDAVELQVRFLIKFVPLLEKIDQSEQVLRLCEYALDIIAKVDIDEKFLQETKSEASSSTFLPTLFTKVITNPPDNKKCNANKINSDLYSTTRNLLELQAALITRSFKHELALGNVDRAHALALKNHDHTRQRDCLHMLITTMCDKGEPASLVQFEYGSMENEFISLLESRAKAADVLYKIPKKKATSYVKGETEKITVESRIEYTDNPFYDALYAFYIRNKRFHSAAGVCFEQALRLAEDFLHTGADGKSSLIGGSRALAILQRQAFCLAATINCLQLVKTEEQWLIQPGSHSGLVPSDQTTDPSADEVDDWAFEDISSRGDGEVRALNVAVSSQMVDNSDFLVREPEGRNIVTMEDIQRQYVIVRSRLRLAQISWEQGLHLVRFISLHELYLAAINSGLLDEALRLSSSFGLDPEPMVEFVANRFSVLMQYKLSFKTSLFNQESSPNCLSSLANAASPLALEKCLILQSSQALSDYFPSVSLFSDNSISLVSGSECNLCSDLTEIYLHLLNVLLTNLDTRSPKKLSEGFEFVGIHGNWDLSLLACHVILSSTPSPIQLPSCLIERLYYFPVQKFAKSRQLEAPVVPLLRLLLKFDRVDEAYHICIDMMKRVIGPVGEKSPTSIQKIDMNKLKVDKMAFPQRVSSSAFCLPHSLLFFLLSELKRLSDSSSHYFVMVSDLSRLMKIYYSSLIEISV